MFDPEKVLYYPNGLTVPTQPLGMARKARDVAKFDGVKKSDYDQLLELYRKERQSAESYANALQYGE